MAVYDTVKLRDIATQIRRMAVSVDGNVKPGVRGALEYMDAFSGRTAQAMEEELTELAQIAGSLEEDIEILSGQISAYADALEQADAKIAELM